MEKQENLKNKLQTLLNQQAKPLQKIYKELPDEKEHCIRGRLNENIGKCFKRIAKGVYIATKGKAQAVIIEGDAWAKMKEFENESFDTIITDSPYSCLNKHYKGTTRQRNRDKYIGFETKDIWAVNSDSDPVRWKYDLGSDRIIFESQLPYFNYTVLTNQEADKLLMTAAAGDL